MSEILVKSADLQGMHLNGAKSDRLGTIREIFVELASGQVSFLIVEAASLLGGSGKFHPIPWSAVRYDAVAKGFEVAMTKETFKTSPSYDRDQLANSNYGWNEQAIRYFDPART